MSEQEKKKKERVVIAGCGLSGIMTGVFVRKMGGRCLVLERSNYRPRRMAGNIINGETYDLLASHDLIYPDFVETEVIKVDDPDSSTGQRIPGRFYAMDGFKFYAWILKNYHNLGGQIKYNSALRFKDHEAGIIETHKGLKIKYDQGVLATGVTNMFSHINSCKLGILSQTVVPLSDIVRKDKIINVSTFYRDEESIIQKIRGEEFLVLSLIRDSQVTDSYALLNEMCRELTCVDLEHRNISFALVPFPKESLTPLDVFNDELYIVGNLLGINNVCLGNGIYQTLRSAIATAECIVSPEKNKSQMYFDKMVEFRNEVSPCL